MEQCIVKVLAGCGIAAALGKQPDGWALIGMKRACGRWDIQCDVHSGFGGITYGYYTITYEGNVLEKEPGVYNSGRMWPFFSDLEKVYE